MKVGTVVTACAVAMMVTVLPRAAAHDHRPPPRPVLTVGDGAQRGRPITVDWLERIDADECEFSAGWRDLSFPSALPFDPASAVDVHLAKEAAPVEWDIRVWDRVDRQGRVEGEGRPVPAVLLAETDPAGRDEWSLRFVLGPLTKHAFVRLDVFWRDEERCAPPTDLGSQSGRWTYHLRAR